MKIRLHTFCAVLICAFGFISSAPQSFAQMRLIPKIPRVGTQRPFIRRPPLPRINLEEHLALFIKQNGRLPSPYAQDPLERFLQQEINRALIQAKASQNPDLTQLKALKEQFTSTTRTPQQILDEVKLFIEDNERWPSSSSEILSERALRKDLDNAIRHTENPRDPAIARLIALHQQWARENRFKSTQEILSKVQDFINKSGHFPSALSQDAEEYALRRAFDSAYLRAIIQRDASSQQLLDLRKEYIDEAIASKPSTIVEKTKSIQRNANERRVREQFHTWFMFVQKKENFAMIVNTKTQSALAAIDKAIKVDNDKKQFSDNVSALVKTIDSYTAMLGNPNLENEKEPESKNNEDKKEETFYYKLIYIGPEDFKETDELPQADKFHLIADQTGIKMGGELSSQVKAVKTLHERRMKTGNPSSVYLFGEDENIITTVGIDPEADIGSVKADLETLIETLLPRNYTVRMGLHEISLSRNNLKKFRLGKVHFHLENTFPSPSYGSLPIHHGVSLRVDMLRFVKYNDAKSKESKEFKPLSDQEIAVNYLTLFEKFLNDDARTALQKIASEPN